MKKLLTLCLAALLSSPLLAIDEAKLCLVMVSIDGAEVNFALNEEPTIFYEDDGVTIIGTYFTIKSASFDEIERFYFAQALPTIDAIGSINAMDGVSTAFTDGKALITGLPSGAMVYVYTAAGQMVAAVEASTDGNACVDLTAVNDKGVLILRTPSASLKIIK